MTAWDYDPAVDAAVIHIVPRDAIPQGQVSTIDLYGCHVLIDVDELGKVLTIEILGMGEPSDLRYLGKRLKEEPGNGTDNHGQQSGTPGQDEGEPD